MNDQNSLRSILNTMASGNMTGNERLSAKKDLLKYNLDLLEVDLLLLTTDPDTGIQEQAIHLLLELDAEKYIDTALQMLDSDDETLRGSICYTLLADLRLDSRATPILSKLLIQSTSSDVRWLAAAALGKTKDQNALPALEYAVIHDEGVNYEGDSVRDMAKTSLAILGKC
jgi:HEAT repeat protein